jgi:hypothetical protein
MNGVTKKLESQVSIEKPLCCLIKESIIKEKIDNSE